MIDAPPPIAPPLQLRADAARNRESLLVAATRAFAASETEPSMRAIAREAGVGIGTLYRHFPTRESLVDAVYHDQVERLTIGADELLEQLPPVEAMRRWMDLFADWLATKHGMTDTLVTMIDSAEDIAASLIGIFTVAGKPEHHNQAQRLLSLLMDGLKPPPSPPPPAPT